MKLRGELEANEPKASFWVDVADYNNLLQVAGNGYEKALPDFVDLIEKSRKSAEKDVKQL